MGAPALLIGATAFGAVGILSQGAAASAEAKQASKIAEYNAKIADENARREIEIARVEEAQQRDRLARTLGSANVARAKSGIRATGSSIFVQDDSIIQGELDALILRNKGVLASNAEKTRASGLRMQSAQYKQQASNARTGALLGAGATILGGAYAYQNSAGVAAASSGRSIPIDYSGFNVPAPFR